MKLSIHEKYVRIIGYMQAVEKIWNKHNNHYVFVLEIAGIMKTSKPTAQKHLAGLFSLGLIDYKIIGNKRAFFLTDYGKEFADKTFQEYATILARLQNEQK